MKQEGQIFKTRNISLNQKKELMWNIIEPGDPYDIRKSMIATLPGQRKFMGGHLELVCLLQAAQIERLCTFLQQYSLKIREQERVQLDRHSYQIQIKELSQRIALDQGFRLQNQKLKDFIRKQSKELQDLQRKSPQIQNSKKYEDSLRQLQVVIKENTDLKATIQKYQSESTLRNEQMRMLELSYQQQLQKHTQRVSFQRGQKQYLEKQKLDLQIERELSLKKAQEEINTFRSKCVELTNKLEVSQNTNRIFKEQSQKFTIQRTKNEQLLHTMKQYQSRFELLATEIDRLNNCLRDKAKQLNQQYVRVKQLGQQKRAVEDINNQLQIKIRGLLSEIEKLQNQIKQIWLQRSNYEERQMLIHQYEQRMQKLSLEVERLNTVLRKKINDLDESRKKNRQLQLVVSNMEMVQKEVGDLRTKLAEVSKKVFQYEKQTTNQYQEIERLNYTLKRMLDQINYTEVKLKNSQKELQNQTKRSLQLQQELEHQIGINQANKRLKENYEQSFRAFKTEIEAKYVNEQASIVNENSYLRAELNKQNISLQELRSLINSQNQELSEQKRLNDQLTKSLAVSQEYTSKLQVRISSYQQQIRQLNENNALLKDTLLSKDNQIFQIKQHTLIIEEQKRGLQTILRKEPPTEKGEEILEEKASLSQLRQEVFSKQDQIKKLKLDIQNKQVQMSEQLRHIQWFQNHCRELDQKITNLLKDCEYFFSQNNEIKNKLNVLEAQNASLIAEVLSYKKGEATMYKTQPRSEEKYFSGTKESEATGFKTQSPDYNLVKISREYEILKQEYEELLSQHKKEKQISADLAYQHQLVFNENQSLKLKIDQQGQYYKKVLIFSQQIERLNGVLQVKDSQNQSTLGKLRQYEQRVAQLEQRVFQTNAQLNSIRQNVGFVPSSIPAVSHYDSQGQVAVLRQQLQSSLALNLEKDGQLSLYQNKISVLGQQIQRLNDILKAKVHQNDELNQVQISLKNERDELFQQLKHSTGSNQVITLYEQKLNLMKSEIQRLNIVLHQKVQSFSSLNDQYNSYRQNQELKSTTLSHQLAEYQAKIHQVNTQLQQLRRRDYNKEGVNMAFVEYERKIVNLSNQVERLNRLLLGNGVRIQQLDQRDNNYLKEIQRLNNALRIKVQECDSRNANQNDLLNQIQRLKQSLAQQRIQKANIAQNRDMFSEEVVKAKQQMYSYEARIQDLYAQFERLQVIMKVLKEENESFKSNSSSLEQLITKNRNLGTEIDRLTLLFDQRTQELNQIRLALVGEATLERRLKEDLSLFVVLFAEIQSLRLRVQNAESQSQQVRRSIASYNRV